jgi:DNA-binding NtrC family response regulator
VLVDHDAGVRFAMGDYFRRIGLLVGEAAVVTEANAWLAQFRYDAVLPNIRLEPGFDDDGLVLARRVPTPYATT